MPAIDLARERGHEPAGGEVVEEEQGLGALHDEVVDAHGDEVDADGMVRAGLGREQHLGADAVGGRDQDRVGEAAGGEIEQAAEAAERAQRPGAARGGRHRRDLGDEIGTGVDVDAGVGIAAAGRCALCRHARVAS